MNIIELHILQSFPVTCLNRDDVGAPKSAIFGGVPRARVSSQCWKRAIRGLLRKKNPHLFNGNRTRYIIREIIKLFQAKGKDYNMSVVLSVILANSIGKLDDVVKGNVKTLIYYSPMEMENVVKNFLGSIPDEDFQILNQIFTSHTDPEKFMDAILSEKKKNSKLDVSKECHDVIKKLLDKAKISAKGLKTKVKDAADISIFGRMVADDSSLTLEGAGLFSHALSTHSVVNEIDFFSAVDDFKPVDSDAGAGHIGTLEFNSACYYRYVGLNLDLLWDEDHLYILSDDERAQVVKAFLTSAIEAVPSARQNSMFGSVVPCFVLGLLREGQPLSLINSFENPVVSFNTGYIEKSRTEMLGHWESLKAQYDLKENIKIEINIPESDFQNFIQAFIEKM